MITEITTSQTYIATAEGDSLVKIFDWDLNLKSELNTIFTTGGERFSLHTYKEIIVCGNYYSGLVAYNLEGNIIWVNKSIKKIQKLNCSKFQKKLLYALTETNHFFAIDLETGEILDKRSKIYNYFELDKDTFAFSYKHNLVYEKDTLKIILFKEAEYTILNTCQFDNEIIVISKIYQPLFAKDIKGGNIWSSTLSGGYRFYLMRRIKETNFFSGIARFSEPSYERKFLVIIDFTNGKIIEKRELESDLISFGYSIDGTQLFCSNGTIIDI